MATLTPQPVSATGTAIVHSPASGGGDVVHNPGGNVKLFVSNGGGSSITVTVTAVEKCNQGQLHNLTVAIAAGADAEIALPRYCNHPVNGTGIAYSSATSVTVAALAD